MNIALSVLNAAALVALVTFHFQDAGQTEQVAAQVQPHHLLRQAPQLAIMTDRSSPSQSAAMLANDSDATIATGNASQRWVF
jgi:hypothetical protein